MVAVLPPAWIVPVRLEPVVFFWTVYERLREPLPDPVPSVIQGTLELAVHPHPLDVVSASEPLPPLLATATEAGDSRNEQGAACWVRTKLRPPTVIVALRALVEVFGDAVKVRVAPPVPEAAPSVTQLGVPVTVHEQPGPVVSVILAEPPPAATVALVEDRL